MLRRARVAPSMCMALFALALPATAGTLPAMLAAQQPPAGGGVTLTGRVTDASTGAPVRGAFVSIDDAGPRAIADSLGVFRIVGVEPGSRRLVVQRFGYATIELRLTVAEAPEPVTVRMEVDPLQLDGLTVTGGARVALSGTVVDAHTDAPLPWVSLMLTRDIVNADGRTAADDRGVFRLADVPTGAYLLRVDRLGYVSQYLPIEIMAPPEPVQVRLEPDTALLRGVEAFERDQRNRRNMSAYTVLAYDESRLRYSGARGMRQFIENHAFIHPCEHGMGDCVTLGGRQVAPSFWIDELQAFGGLNELDSYRPDEFHSLEIFRCRTTVSIRAYTYAFMERMGRRPRQMIPLCLA